MGAEIHNGEVLATWKEIASYLKTSIRTCIRWEANDGLPVHRQEGASKSRVYAYKLELDAWFKARLSNGTLTVVDERSKPRSSRPVLVLVALLAIAGAGALFLLTREKGRPSDPKPTPSGVPLSIGSFDMIPKDVIESEWGAAGYLRIWRRKNAASWLEAWRINPVRHTSLAVGNLDSESRPEVVAPGHCREYYDDNGREAIRIRFFLNAYKIDFKDWWKTTFYDPPQCVLEKENYEFTEVAVGDVDPLPGNEIVLVTAHSLSVFRYDPSLKEIRRIATRTSFVEGANPLFRSLALADVDGDGGIEILAIANDGEEESVVENKSWLFVLEMREGQVAIRDVVSFDATTSAHSLRAGDVIPGGNMEMLFPLYRKAGDTLTTSVAGWTSGAGVVFEYPLDNPGYRPKSDIFLDAGNLTSANSGDELVVARHDPNEVVVFTWDGGKLKQGPKYAIPHSARVNGVKASGIGSGRKRQPRILVYGSCDVPGNLGRSYLEVLDFKEGFFPLWQRMGGEPTDLPVTYASFVGPFRD